MGRAKRQKPPQPRSIRPPSTTSGTSTSSASSTTTPAAITPRFWFDFSLPWAKVVLVRVALFGVLALDAFLALRHAPRYGSGFNVANLRVLDGLAPGRAAFGAIELTLAYLFALFALGVGLRLLPLAAALYGWVYFSSQLDSYQHHYLVFLVLVLACFAPWRRPPAASTDAAPAERATSWAFRLVLVQLAIVYAWAAAAKLTGAWLDGSALHTQIATPWMAHLIDRLPGGWATAARVTLALECFLAIAVWCRPLWWLAFPLGVAFHINIELSGLQIGLFSYVMVALYTLAIPDAVFRAGASIVARGSTVLGTSLETWVARARAASDRLGDWPLVVPALLAVVAGSALLVAIIPVAPAVIVVLVAAGALIGTLVARAQRGPSAAAHVLIAHILAALALFAFDRTTTVSYDYYKFWGGSARRLGHTDEERVAYRRLLDIDPSSVTGHYYLANLDATDGHDDDARAHWHAAEELAPHDARAFAAEARWLLGKGRHDEALAAARAAAAADPTNPDAQRLVTAIAGGNAAAPPAAPPTHDDPDDSPR